MSSRRSWGLTVLFLRLLAFASLVVAIIVLATDNVDIGAGKLRFQDVHAYRYVISVAAIGAAYLLVQVLFAGYYVQHERHLVRDDQANSSLHVADVVVALLLATGAGAGYGLTAEEKRNSGDGNNPFNKFLNRALISTSFVLLATACMGILVLIKK